MNSILLSIDGSVTRRVTVALFGAAMLAACDSDRTVSPTSKSTSAQIPTSGSAAFTPSGKGNLILRAYNLDKSKLLGGASYQILGPKFVSATVVDGGAFDADTIPGSITLNQLAMGTYNVCQIVRPTGYEFAIPKCRGWVVQSDATQAGEFMSAPLVSATWDVKDGFGALLGPSTFTIGLQRSLTKITVVDNGPNDLEPELGRITAKLPKPGIYTLCETVPPPNRYNANPACVTVDDSGGEGLWVGSFINYEQQVFKP